MAGHQKRAEIAHKTQQDSVSILSMPKTCAPLLNHEARQHLIRQPFQSRRIPGKSWAGVLISETVPSAGRRAFDPSSHEDESYLRYGGHDDDTLGD